MRIHSILPVPLFRSDSQASILASLFFSDNGLTVQELSKRSEIPYSTIHREISRLLKSGVLTEERVGNYRFFAPNRVSPLYAPLHDLLEVLSGPIPLLRKELTSIPGIEWVALFGSWAHRLLGKDGMAPQDVDVLVVGTPEVRQINKACSAVSKTLGWEVNPVILTHGEWIEESPFLRQIRRDGLVPIFGTQEWSGKNEPNTSLLNSNEHSK